jgi:glycosyltransferase involved in cell wall biosynthesis
MMEVTTELLEGEGHETIPFAIREGSNPLTPWRSYFPSISDLRRQPLPSGAGGASPYSLPARRRMLSLVRAARPDIAHLHNVFGKLTLSIVDALDDEGVAVVLTLHDYKAVCPNGLLFTHDGICHRCLHGGRFWNAVRHCCSEGSRYSSLISAAEAYVNRFRRTLMKVAAFIAPSEFMRGIIVSAGLPSQRVYVLPNPAKALAAPRSGLGSNPYFLYSGRLVRGKGLDVLLSAAHLMNVDERIFLYGAGPLEERLRDEIKRQRLPIEICGYGPKRLIAEMLDGCTALLLPSLWYENCPMAILEAAGRGVASVVSDLGGMKELVSHRQSGLLFPPGDARSLASCLDELARRPEWALELGREAWAHVRKRHDPAAHLQGLMTIYEEARARRSGPLSA